MVEIARRDLVIGGALLGAAGVGALARPPARPPAIDQGWFEAAIPSAIGAYRAATLAGLVLPPRDELSQQLYDGYVARAYVAPGMAPVFLLVAVGSVQDYALQLHRPESCYPASGFSIVPRGTTPLRLGARAVPGTVLEARRPGRADLVLYWTRMGEAFPTGLWPARALILRAALERRTISGALVRLSTTLGDPAADAERLARFAAALVTAMAPPARALLLGPGA